MVFSHFFQPQLITCAEALLSFCMSTALSSILSGLVFFSLILTSPYTRTLFSGGHQESQLLDQVTIRFETEPDGQISGCRSRLWVGNWLPRAAVVGLRSRRSRSFKTNPIMWDEHAIRPNIITLIYWQLTCFEKFMVRVILKVQENSQKHRYLKVFINRSQSVVFWTFSESDLFAPSFNLHKLSDVKCSHPNPLDNVYRHF